jgi:polyisoprenoid-binding protein YceI
MLKNKIAIAAVLAALASSAFAANGTYTIDPTHTFPSLEFSHMNLSISSTGHPARSSSTARPALERSISSSMRRASILG